MITTLPSVVFFVTVVTGITVEFITSLVDETSKAVTFDCKENKQKSRQLKWDIEDWHKTLPQLILSLNLMESSPSSPQDLCSSRPLELETLSHTSTRLLSPLALSRGPEDMENWEPKNEIDSSPYWLFDWEG